VVPLPLHKEGWMVSTNSKYLPHNKASSSTTNPSLTFDISKYGHRKLKTEYEKQLQNYYA